MIPRSRSNPIYTLGTSNRSAEEFIELLKQLSIEVVIDVRRYPVSRFEHFRQANMVRLLQDNNIDYISVGEYLGGHREGGYKAFMATETFGVGLGKLEEAARAKTAVIICAERLPRKCHRRFIAAELQSRGWETLHIIDTTSELIQQRKLFLP